MELKDRLRLALDARGMEVGWVERHAGIGRGVLQRLVTGERTGPRPETLDKVARVLRVSYQWLATGAGQMEPVEEVIVDPFPGRADLRRTQYWRDLPDDLRGAIMRMVPPDPEMSLEGWVLTINHIRQFGGLAAPAASAPPEPTPRPAAGSKRGRS